MPFCDTAADRFYTAVRLGTKCSEQKKHKRGFFSLFLPYFSAVQRQDRGAAAKGILHGPIQNKKINTARDPLNYVFTSARIRQKYPSRCHLVNITRSLRDGRLLLQADGCSRITFAWTAAAESRLFYGPTAGGTPASSLSSQQPTGEATFMKGGRKQTSPPRLSFPRCDAPAL